MADVHPDLNSIHIDVDSKLVVEGGRPGPTSWTVSVRAYPTVSADEDEELDDAGPPQLLWMDGWTFDLGIGMDLADRMDEISGDAEVFTPLIDGDDLSERLEDELGITPVGSKLVLLNHVHLIKELRGRGGIGRYLTGLAIRQLDADAGLVALHASPFELHDTYGPEVPDDLWESGAEALGHLWQSIGFQRYDGHVYVLNPSLITLDDAVEELRRDLASG